MSGTVNQFNTGRDCTVVILHPLAPGGRIDLPLVTDFDVKPKYHDISSNGIDGFTRTMHVPQNLDVMFSVDRSDPTIDTFCSALWTSYRATGRIPAGSVYQYVTELNGSTTTTNFTSVVFKPDDLGSWKKDSAVAQKLSGTAMDYARL